MSSARQMSSGSVVSARAGGVRASDAAAPSSLSSAVQVARYLGDGYVAPLDALTHEAAAAARRRLEPLLAPQGGLADARLRNNPHLILPWVAALACHPRVLDAVEALLGPDLLIWRSVFFVKPPHDAGYVAWHQDLAYWDLSDDRSVTAWIALTDSTAANGCVRVVPGSHRGALLDHTRAHDKHNRLLRGQVAACDVPPDSVRPLELRAGQFSLHHVRLLHSSPPNPSGELRAGLAVRYVRPDVRTAGPRHVAVLARGVDRHGFYELSPPARRDDDPAALAAHARSLRRYGLHAFWRIVCQPTPSHLALLVRMSLRRDLLQAVLPWRRRGARKASIDGELSP
jgi:ectoine hydroxylase-related dioxygenase (phytanoyl-CoA dioxygenase family)